MGTVSKAFCADSRRLMAALGVSESPWLEQAGELFESELSGHVQYQVRLDASFVGLVLRSTGGDIRAHLYSLLAERLLDFQVASRCEDLAKGFPDAPWLGKVSLSGGDLHAKLYLDSPLSFEELEEALPLVEVPTTVGLQAAKSMVDALGGGEGVTRLSASPGEPVRVEVYGEKAQEPGGGESPLEELFAMTGLEGDPNALALVDLHQEMARSGDQRYVVAMDGRGIRDGFKVEYTRPAIDAVYRLIEAFVPGPIFAERRLKSAMEALGSPPVDHVSVRLRPRRPVHLTVYFRRNFRGVA